MTLSALPPHYFLNSNTAVSYALSVTFPRIFLPLKISVASDGRESVSSLSFMFTANTKLLPAVSRELKSIPSSASGRRGAIRQYFPTAFASDSY